MNPVRYWKRFRAWLGDWPVFPCRQCGQEMYGFEHADHGFVRDETGQQKSICPECANKNRIA